MLDKNLLSLNDTAAILGVTTDQVLTMVNTHALDFVLQNGWKFFTLESVVKVHIARQEVRNQSRWNKIAVFDSVPKDFAYAAAASTSTGTTPTEKRWFDQ